MYRNVGLYRQYFPASFQGVLALSICSGLIALTAGCGSKSTEPPGNTQPAGPKPVIVIQPSNISVPPGDSATFTVVAQGPGPLSYQWNDATGSVAGATSATLTIPDVEPAENGADYSVTVSNAAGYVTSIPAYLTVGPRSPKPGDLRFKGVDLISNSQAELTGYTNLFGYGGSSVRDSLGSPISIGKNQCGSGGPGNCGWGYDVFSLAFGMSPINSNYQSDTIDRFQSDLNSVASFDSVITAIDLRPSQNIFALSALSENQNAGFDVAYHTVPLSGLQAAAAKEGSQSRVITALSFVNGQVFYLSYGWALDTATVYETQTATATADNLLQAATELASQGYIITAYGGDGGDTTGTYVLVGTRVQGDTYPRPIDEPGAAVVAWVNGTSENLAPIIEN